MQDAFDIADRYRTPVILMGDGMLGQMMEPVEFHKPEDEQEKRIGQQQEQWRWWT